MKITVTSGALMAATILTLAGCGAGGSGPNAPIPASTSFCDSKVFTDPASSPYVLPWSPGSTYTMFQGNCSALGGHRDTFAYDFDLNMGDPVFASRPGEVIIANDQFSDDDHVEGHREYAAEPLPSLLDYLVVGPDPLLYNRTIL